MREHHHISHTRRHTVTQSRRNRGSEVHLHLAGVITTENRFHARENFPEQLFFSHVTIFRRKNVLAGISRRPKIPERALATVVV